MRDTPKPRRKSTLTRAKKDNTVPSGNKSTLKVPAVRGNKPKASPAPATRPVKSPAKTVKAASTTKGTVTSTNYDYDVCTSFAGEDRTFVEAVVRSLRRRGVKCFYDLDEQARLWGQDLLVYLDEVYRNRARHCLMFVSEHYTKKLWTNHERESAQARAFQSGGDYILPVRLDDAVVPGLRPSRGYIDGRKLTPGEVAAMVKAKITGQPAPSRRAVAKPARASASTTSPATSTVAVVRPSRAKAPAGPEATPASRKVTDSGRWVLLGQDFYESTLVTRKQGEYLVHIAPKTAREEATLRALESRPHWQRAEVVAFAHGNDAVRCRLEEIAARSEAGKHVYTLTLRPEGERSGWNMGAVLYNNLPTEQMAQKRAELILLGKAPATGDTYKDQHIQRGFGGDVIFDADVVVTTLRALGGAATLDNLRKARLAALYQLLAASRVVEHILELSLGPASKSGIPVVFEGSPPVSSNRTPASPLRVEGRVLLTTAK